MACYDRKEDGWFCDGNKVKLEELREEWRQALALVDASGVFNLGLIKPERARRAAELTNILCKEEVETEGEFYIFRCQNSVRCS